NRGGLETLMLDVSRKLKKTDCEAIAVYRKEGVLRDEFLNTTVPLTYLPVRRNLFAYVLKLRKYFKTNKVELVHAQQYLDALLAYIALWCTRTKVVLTLHGFDFEGDNRLLRHILKKTHANIYVSEYQRKYYTRKYRLKSNKQFVIYNGIDFSKINQLETEQSNRFRKELGIDKSALLMGMVGNFNLVRNQLFICRFLKVLKEKEPNFHFVFIGKRIESLPHKYDMCINYCEQYGLKENVSFLGVRDDVPDILSQLDAFVYATEYDTFGIAVVEAIASGIPVFTNDWEVMNEVSENGKLANLYKTNNEIDLLEKFVLFLQDRDSFSLKSKQASNIVKEKYGIEKHIEKLKEIYEQILTYNS
ncbi:MAG: glycosyltransferase family 4 protein, partial [Dysgonomonas sp.]